MLASPDIIRLCLTYTKIVNKVLLYLEIQDLEYTTIKHLRLRLGGTPMT